MENKEERVYGLRNENLPAYPCTISFGDADFTGMPIINHKTAYGITKREYFMALALSGFIAKHGAVDFTVGDIERINNAVDLIMNIR